MGRFFLFLAAELVCSHPVVVPTAQQWVRIPRPKIEELALQAQGVGIFAHSEYPSSAAKKRTKRMLRSFFIQSEGLVCNLTAGEYGIAVGV